MIHTGLCAGSYCQVSLAKPIFTQMLILHLGLSQIVVCSKYATRINHFLTAKRNTLDFCPIPLCGRHWLCLSIRQETSSSIPKAESSTNTKMDDQYSSFLHDQCFKQPCV
jgi:hypothetical protein